MLTKTYELLIKPHTTHTCYKQVTVNFYTNFGRNVNRNMKNKNLAKVEFL